MIGIDSQSVYHFGYPLFLTLPDLTTKVNSFYDLNKDRHLRFAFSFFACLCDWVSAYYTTFVAAIKFFNWFSNCGAGQINMRLNFCGVVDQRTLYD